MVIPGKKERSLRQISLDLVFEDELFYRKESMVSEVVDFWSAYNAIFGRPAYTHFMARPCYVYLKLKLPCPNGVITISEDRQRAKIAYNKVPLLLMNRWQWPSLKNTRKQ